MPNTPNKGATPLAPPRPGRCSARRPREGRLGPRRMTARTRAVILAGYLRAWEQLSHRGITARMGAVILPPGKFDLSIPRAARRGGNA
eukprot:COSAG04_NODE_7168_length_1175_cov_2.087361_1_plen_88_part_00